MFQLFVIALLFVLAIGFAVGSTRAITRVSQAEDDPAARGRFLLAFAAESLPTDLLVRLYDTLGRRARATPWAGARLADDLGLSAADVEDVALLVAARCEARLPHAPDLDALDRDVHTVRDLVRFLVPFWAPAARAARVTRAA